MPTQRGRCVIEANGETPKDGRGTLQIQHAWPTIQEHRLRMWNSRSSVNREDAELLLSSDHRDRGVSAQRPLGEPHLVVLLRWPQVKCRWVPLVNAAVARKHVAYAPPLQRSAPDGTGNVLQSKPRRFAARNPVSGRLAVSWREVSRTYWPRTPTPLNVNRDRIKRRGAHIDDADRQPVEAQSPARTPPIGQRAA